MRMRYLVGVLLAACSDPTGPTLSDAELLQLQIIPDLDPDDLPDDHASITSARIEGHTLFMTMSFGGGCATHRFALVTDGAVAESNPPQMLLRLAHDGDRDPCDALLTRTVQVDLAVLTPLMQTTGPYTIRLRIAEPDGEVADVGELLITF